MELIKSTKKALSAGWCPNARLQLALLASIVGLLRNYRLLASREQQLDPYLEAGVPPLPSAARTLPSAAVSGLPLPPPSNPNGDFWERDDSSCLHLDNICSWNDRWFYAPNFGAGNVHQPNARLVVRRKDIAASHGHDIAVKSNITLDVSSSSHRYYNEEACAFSPTPYHLVVQSGYDHMMGEFYSRALLAINRWMHDYPTRSKEDVQMYVHFVDKRKQKLFEGHRLFLGGLPNNDKFESFISMMPNNETCRCYTKLIFCGYSAENISVTTTIMEDDDDSDDDDDEDDDGDRTRATMRQNVTIFKPLASILNPKTGCQKDNPRCTVYRNLRRDLLDMFKAKDPMLDEKIRQYRRQILIRKGLLDSSNSTDADEWKFVGLAHRKFRRRWLNIEDAISMCEKKFTSQKVACIMIDVEEADIPEEQLLMHHSLHALIGVHGAQLTQGVLLPRHGYVLELLPWVPFYLLGAWVTTTHAPTPLGVIFHETALNHVGYPLGRDSVPLCLDVDPLDENRTRNCLMNETSGVLAKFRWADRDFNVPLTVIEDFIGGFLLQKNSICDDVHHRADVRGFVLYNAFCQRNATQRRFQAEHYYWKQDDSQPKNIHQKG